MDIVLSFVVTGLCIVAVIGYIAAAFETAKTAHEKGHGSISAAVCLFLGIPYMITVMSLPNLKARQGDVQSDYNVALSGEISSQQGLPKSLVAFIVAAVVVVGGILGVNMLSTNKEAKTIELASEEYEQACEVLESSILSSSDCKEAKITSIDFSVTSVEKYADEYIVTITAKCQSSAHYGYGSLGQLEKELDGILVAYEILRQIPTSLKLSNGEYATIFNSNKQFYVYVNGDMVYYPGFKYSY